MVAAARRSVLRAAQATLRRDRRRSGRTRCGGMRSLGTACNAASAAPSRAATASPLPQRATSRSTRRGTVSPSIRRGDEEAAAEIARIVAVEHDVRDRHAGGFGGADRLRFEHDRRQFDVRVRNRGDDQLVPLLAVVGVEQHVQPARAGAGDAQPRNVDVAVPPLRQEAREAVSSPRRSRQFSARVVVVVAGTDDREFRVRDFHQHRPRARVLDAAGVDRRDELSIQFGDLRLERSVGRRRDVEQRGQRIALARQRRIAERLLAFAAFRPGSRRRACGTPAGRPAPASVLLRDKSRRLRAAPPRSVDPACALRYFDLKTISRSFASIC